MKGGGGRKGGERGKKKRTPHANQLVLGILFVARETCLSTDSAKRPVSKRTGMVVC